MKYVMLVTAEGQHLPIIFPEALTHYNVANYMGRLVDAELKLAGKTRTLPASAGFLSVGDVVVTGASESLGDLKSKPLDAYRIMLGASVSHMPDALLAPVAQMVATKLGDDLRKAAEMVEQWWLVEGMHHFNGAPAAIFALRAALKGESE